MAVPVLLLLPVPHPLPSHGFCPPRTTVTSLPGWDEEEEEEDVCSAAGSDLAAGLLADTLEGMPVTACCEATEGSLLADVSSVRYKTV